MNKKGKEDNIWRRKFADEQLNGDGKGRLYLEKENIVFGEEENG